MISFLAQASPPPAALASFLEVAFYLVGLLTAVVVLYRHVYPAAISPQPLTVRGHIENASSDDLREVHGRIKRERDEINRELVNLKDEQKAMRLKLDAEISDLHNRINEVPGRTIQLLRETKGLI